MKSIGSQIIVMPYYSEESTSNLKERIKNEKTDNKPNVVK